MHYIFEIGFLVLGLSAIVLPWIGLKRTGRSLYRMRGILDPIVCGWCCLGIIASWFVAVMPSYIFLANPLLFMVATGACFFCGANSAKSKNDEPAARAQ